MRQRSRSKPAAASKAGPAKPSAAQQQEQEAQEPDVPPQKRKRTRKTAAAQHFDVDSDADSLLGDLGEDRDWDPTAADSEDELADDFLAGLADELEASQDESDQEAAACQPRKASAR
jgi:hypothetical protein